MFVSDVIVDVVVDIVVDVDDDGVVDAHVYLIVDAVERVGVCVVFMSVVVVDVGAHVDFVDDVGTECCC